MKRIQLLFLILFIATFSMQVYAQFFSIEGIQRHDADLDARLNYARKDQNGRTCAIIKIETPITGFSFDTGSMPVQYVMEKNGQIWVYVMPGIRKITIAHQSMGVVRDWVIPLKIEEACVYALHLNTIGSPSSSLPSSTVNPERKVLYTLRPQERIVFGETLLSFRYRPSGDHFATIIRDTIIGKDQLIVDGVKKVIADSIIVNFINFDDFKQSNYAYREKRTTQGDGQFFNCWTVCQDGNSLSCYPEPRFSQDFYTRQNSAGNIRWANETDFSYYYNHSWSNYSASSEIRSDGIAFNRLASPSRSFL